MILYEDYMISNLKPFHNAVTYVSNEEVSLTGYYNEYVLWTYYGFDKTITIHYMKKKDEKSKKYYCWTHRTYKTQLSAERKLRYVLNQMKHNNIQQKLNNMEKDFLPEGN